jgi:hypothetical protein
MRRPTPFDGYSAGPVEGGPLFARLPDAGLPGGRGLALWEDHADLTVRP